MEFLLIPILSVLAVVGLALTVDTSTVVFNPIGVPPEWENRGYTSDVVSVRLTDHIRHINGMAASFKRGRGVRLGTAKTVTRELGSYLGLAAPIWIVQQEMGLIEFTIGGEIVLVDKDKSTYQFLLRSSSLAGKGSVLTSKECGSIDKPDDLIALAAEETMHAINPYILAAYYFDGEEDAYYEAREKVQDKDDGHTPESGMGAKIEAYNTCAELARNVGPFHNTVSTIKYGLGRLPMADRKWCYDLWGLVHMVKDEYELAIEKFKLALAIDPNFAIAIHNWGIALAEQKNYRAAIDKYQEALAAGARMPGVYNAWAVALGKLGYSEEAISVFQMGMKMDPKYAEPYHGLGELYESLGQTRKANELYKQAVALDPTGEKFKQDLKRTDKML